MDILLLVEIVSHIVFCREESTTQMYLKTI